MKKGNKLLYTMVIASGVVAFLTSMIIPSELSDNTKYIATLFTFFMTLIVLYLEVIATRVKRLK